METAFTASTSNSSLVTVVPPMKAGYVCYFAFRPTSHYLFTLYYSLFIHWFIHSCKPTHHLTWPTVWSILRKGFESDWCTRGVGGSIHKLEGDRNQWSPAIPTCRHKLQTIPISWYQAEIMHHKKLQQDGKRGTSEGQWQIQRPNKGTPTCLLSITNLRLSAASCRGRASCWFPVTGK